MSLDYKAYVGQYVKIYLNNTLRFTGIINSNEIKKLDNGIDYVYQDINCVGLNGIASRRTIQIDEAEGTTVSTIVSDVVTDILSQEGIEAGRIDAGSTLKEDWNDDIISVSDILDQCASLSGYQWFIDKDFKLQFYQDGTVSTCTYSLTDAGTFQDFRNVVVTENLDNYCNKVFVLGGNDDHGDLIYTVNGSVSLQNSQQLITGGSGTFGLVNRDSGLTQHAYITASANTSSTVIVYNGHNFVNGDMFWNVTRNIRSFITDASSSTNSVSCETVSSQAAGDTIEVYRDVNKVGANLIKRQGFIPTELKFDSYSLEFNPSEQLQVSLSDVSVSGYFNIDEVSIKEQQANYFIATIKAILRDPTNYSTQRNPNYTEFFRGF